MNILQKFGFRESRYERPQDKWVCGRLAEGKPCSMGPGGDGSCRVTSVCQPHMEDGRWECRRSLQDGGTCDAGPLPDGSCCNKLERCAPRPSMRTQRKRWSLWATALTVGLVVLILSGGMAKELLMPGPLSQPHANLTDCKTCHAGVEPDNLGWLHQFTASVGPKQNAELCISCHDVGAQPFAPHTNPVEQLKRMTEAYTSSPKSRPVQSDSWVHTIAFPGPDPKPAPAEAQVYCATCHEEHQGLYSDLTTLSNDRCQTCHTSKFGTFADSHPQFEDYPFDRRTRIAFNHKSHFGKHFPKTKEAATPGQITPGVCADCHQPGPAQKYMEIRSFEAMCHSCHNKDVLGTNRADSKGVEFLTVPGLDVATLVERGKDVGEWPADSEAPVTAFIKMLLPAETKDVAGIKDLLDLTDAKEEDLDKVKTLAWSIKRLFLKLERGGLPTTMELPPNADGTEIDRTQVARMAGMLSHDVIKAGNQEWFGTLEDDLLQHDKGEQTKSFKKQKEEKEAAAVPADTTPSETKATQTDGDESLDSDSAGLEEESAGLEDESVGLEEESAGLEEESAGLEEESAGLEEESAGLEEESAGLEDESAGLEVEGADAATDTAKEQKDNKATETAVPEQVESELWAKFGGWYRQDFAIRYRPLGHADQFLKAWLDFAGRAYGGSKKDEMMPIFDQLAPNGAVGRCTKCHSVDERDGFKQVKWEAFSAQRVKSRFTKFSHDAHISAVGSKGCVSCHQLSPTPSGDHLKTYQGGDPGVYDQNFMTLDKQLCATCHTEQAAGETCVLCHQYHSTEFSKPLVKTKLP